MALALMPWVPRADATGTESKAIGGALSVPSYTIDGGGGLSTGGGLSVIGSIGQPDADPLHPATGGGYALFGGFIPAALASEPLDDPLFADGFEN